jgi:tyrosine-protein kinase Etk/Wzc
VAEGAVKERRGLVDPASPSSEPLRTLRLALELRDSERSGNVVLFTSATPAEGKSTLAANYALITATAGAGPVLLIDGDLRKPTLHEFFQTPRTPGLVEALASGAPLDGKVQHVESPYPAELDFLPAGGVMPRPGDLAASDRMQRLLHEASERYSVVIVDSPPVLSAADAAGIASHPGVDVVLVVKRRTRRRTLMAAIRKLQLVDAHVAGIVLNREGHLALYGYGY